ncbi:MAG: metal-dependent transcriptional regulator [Parasporobacterium sp.]|nr:metal-dependent transcriptional regulator [Parasporobacterium sp.]
MQINESVENYLESILMISKRKGNVRSIDIVHELNFSKPSVSIAMHRLKDNGYVKIDDSGNLTLTKKGMAIASATYERHELLKAFLLHIGVSEATAEDDACKMEHAISEETFECLKKVSKKIEK